MYSNHYRPKTFPSEETFFLQVSICKNFQKFFNRDDKQNVVEIKISAE